MMKRPGGYGDTSLLEMNPKYQMYVSKKPYVYAGLIALPLLLVGLLPVIWMYTPLHQLLGMPLDMTWNSIGISLLGETGVFGILEHPSGRLVGPFGILSIILGLFVPLSVAVFFMVANTMRTKELIVERDKYKEVEEEYTS